MTILFIFVTKQATLMRRSLEFQIIFWDISVPARVYFTETVQYIPKGLRGLILCHIEAEPPIDFVTWTKNKRLFDPFETPGVIAIKTFSLSPVAFATKI